MHPRERLLNTLAGEPTDRVPVFPSIPFGVAADGFYPAPFHGRADYDNFREEDPAYCRLVRRMQDDCDHFFIWSAPGMRDDRLFVPPALKRTEPPVEQEGTIVTTDVVRAGGRELRRAEAVTPRTGHVWTLKHYCDGPGDARRLLELPWEAPSAEADDFFEIQQLLGERGVMWVSVPSPILVVCRLFDPTEFLMLLRTDMRLVHRLMEVIAERIRSHLEALLGQGVGPIVRFGGAEHLTPPLASPRDFDELVVRYDRPLMDLVRTNGRMVAVHCHGRLRHALRRFVEMGVAQTDPAEQVPDGDLTLAAMRRMAAGQMTLTGNLQMRELATLEPMAIRERVRQIVRDAGPDHLVLSVTAAPHEPIVPHIERNYHAFMDAALEFGTR